MAAHEFIVKVGLSAEEFIAFKSIAEEEGQSQSSLGRQLIKRHIALWARRTAQSGTELASVAMAEPGREGANAPEPAATT